MDIFQAIKAWFTSGKIETLENYCPNCWGFQEYSDNFYEAVKNHGITINDIDANRGWIQNYADLNLGGIKFSHKENEETVCNQCKVKYKLQS